MLALQSTHPPAPSSSHLLLPNVLLATASNHNDLVFTLTPMSHMFLLCSAKAALLFGHLTVAGRVQHYLVMVGPLLLHFLE